MIDLSGGVAERLSRINSKIISSCELSGRSPEQVELVAISKYQPVELIREAASAGQLSFGENYAQEFVSKRLELFDLSKITWHFTGHLQANKAKMVVGQCKLIQSVDSAKIAGKIAGIASAAGFVQDILVEVNSGSDPAKTGVPISEALQLCEATRHIDGISLKGLMTIAPYATREEPGASREYFAKVRALFELLPDENRQILSMGMSGDFDQAIAEGSTMIRVGTAIFGSRTQLSRLSIQGDSTHDVPQHGTG